MKLINQTNTKSDNPELPNSIALGSELSVDLSFLSDEEKSALYSEYAKGVMELSLTAKSYDLDTHALRRTLNDISDHVDEVSIKGSAVTLAHTHKSKNGSTEVLLGNTRKAKSGKLASKNEEDFMPMYIIGGLITLVIIGAMVS